MRKTRLATALILAATALPASAEGWMDTAAQPAYRTVETVTDGVYGLLRGHLFSSLLPGRLSRRMSSVPQGTSYALFSSELRLKQERAARRIVETRPIGQASAPAAWTAWRDQAFQAQSAALTDAFAQTLVRRYQLERFGKDSGAYAGDPRNWDPGFLASAALLGGAYVYVAGLRANWTMGPVRAGFEARPGAALRGAAQSGEGRGLAALTLSRRGSPISLKTEWGVKDGRMASERVGVNYSARF